MAGRAGRSAARVCRRLSRGAGLRHRQPRPAYGPFPVMAALSWCAPAHGPRTWLCAMRDGPRAACTGPCAPHTGLCPIRTGSRPTGTWLCAACTGPCSAHTGFCPICTGSHPTDTWPRAACSGSCATHTGFCPTRTGSHPTGTWPRATCTGPRATCTGACTSCTGPCQNTGRARADPPTQQTLPEGCHSCPIRGSASPAPPGHDHSLSHPFMPTVAPVRRRPFDRPEAL